MTNGGSGGARAAHHTGQAPHAYRFDWGLAGLHALVPHADIVIIVDVLRFTSAVSAALEAGGSVLPHPWNHDNATAFAAERGAVLAGRREDGGPSLSPTDLLTMAAGTRVVLPSPNGSALTCAAVEHGARRVLAGCLRNATATAAFARRNVGLRGVIAVVAAGERWDAADGPLRMAVEDLLGAGAILAALDPSGAVGSPCSSPEARAARAAFSDARPQLYEHLRRCASGLELAERGWDDDVATSSALDVTNIVAELVDGIFRPA